MTREDKQLLLKDLCARLPYGVKVHYTKHPDCTFDEDCDDTAIGYYCNLLVCNKTDYCLDRCKPYLRPMSSMTEEEKDIYFYLQSEAFVGTSETLFSIIVDWLNAHHFDYRGLIDEGLAIEVTEENNPYKD